MNPQTLLNAYQQHRNNFSRRNSLPPPTKPQKKTQQAIGRDSLRTESPRHVIPLSLSLFNSTPGYMYQRITPREAPRVHRLLPRFQFSARPPRRALPVFPDRYAPLHKEIHAAISLGPLSSLSLFFFISPRKPSICMFD